ncbi:hypothetical protein BGZ94_000552 [Podila epigama]|nr:hypothetical protein BGZ94_000552 [Podila epigama]
MVAMNLQQSAPQSAAVSDEGFRRLMEIETMYRTHRTPDQLQAIASFPKLFDEFPVPVIINAAILKLSDYYRNSVIHSLDSSEAMEVSAAVYAADRICAQSQRFCAIISGKLAFMVRNSKTPLPLRRRLIRIFGHMFEDITLARLARKTCLDILDLSQDKEYTVAILRALTRLASHSLVDVQHQIDLLLQRARDHPSGDIQRVSLACLGSLAQKGIEFHPHQIKAIFDLAAACDHEKTAFQCLVTLRTIFQQTSSILYSIIIDDKGRETVGDFIRTSIKIIQESTSRLVQLEYYSLLSVLIPGYKEFVQSEIEETIRREAVAAVTQSMKQYLVWIWSSMTVSQSTVKRSSEKIRAEEAAQARVVLEYLLSMTLKQVSPKDNVAVDLLFETLLKWINDYQDWSVLLSKALLHLMLLFRTILESATMTRAMLTSDDAHMEATLTPLIERFIYSPDSTETSNPGRWELYLMVRYSLQSGWPQLASIALQSLALPEQSDNIQSVVQSVPHGLWLSAVQLVAAIESSVQHTGRLMLDALQQRPIDIHVLDLYKEQQGYAKIIGHLEELSTYSIDRKFHLDLCLLRRDFLRTCQLANTSLHQLSASLARNQGQFKETFYLPGDEAGLLKSADQLNGLAHEYTLLQASVPSASIVNGNPSRDSSSDKATEILYTLCLVLAYSLQKVASILIAHSKSSSSTSAGAGGENEGGETFDIDPLLIPLLFGQEQYKDDEHSGTTFAARKTSIKLFRESTRQIFDYLAIHLHGTDEKSLEASAIEGACFSQPHHE